LFKRKEVLKWLSEEEKTSLTTDVPITKSYMGMLALARARLAQVRAAARGEPSFSMTITLTSTWALGNLC
jgi:hypothetical protein